MINPNNQAPKKRRGGQSLSPYAVRSEQIALRIPHEDRETVRAAADKLGVPLAAFIRMAAIRRAEAVLAAVIPE